MRSLYINTIISFMILLCMTGCNISNGEPQTCPEPVVCPAPAICPKYAECAQCDEAKDCPVCQDCQEAVNVAVEAFKSGADIANKAAEQQQKAQQQTAPQRVVPSNADTSNRRRRR